MNIILLLLLIIIIIFQQKKSRFGNTKPLYFIHIPKNAGTKVKGMLKINGIDNDYNWGSKPLEDIYGVPCAYMHLPRKYDPEINFKDYLTFLIVRNPYDRIVSGYNWRIEKNIISSDKNINKFINENISNIPNKSINFQGDCHFLPQVEYIYDYYGNVVDEILHFENLDQDFINFINKYSLNITYDNTIDNKSEKYSTIEDLTEESKQLIKEYYSEDFITFGYSVIV